MGLSGQQRVINSYKPVFSEKNFSQSEIKFQPIVDTNQNFERSIHSNNFSPVIQQVYRNSKQYYLSNISGETLLDKLNRNQVLIEVFPDAIVEVETTLVPSYGAHGSIFYAASNNEDKGVLGGSVALTIIDNKVYGKIWSNDRLLIIEPLPEGNLHIIAEQSTGHYQEEKCGKNDDHCCSLFRNLDDFNSIKSHAEVAHLIDGPTTVSAPEAIATGNNIADFVAYYNAGALNYYGSSSNAVNKITQYINETNTAFINSNVDACLNSLEITYFNSTSRYDAANRRNQLCADIAASVGTGYYKDESNDEIVNCGNAERWQENGADGTNIVASPSCSDSQFTFSHEIGHVYEANHYDDSDAGDFRGAIIQTNVTKTLLTKEPGTRVLHYSNPDVFYNGQVTGQSNRRNADIMETLADDVANFNLTYLGCSPDNNFDYDSFLIDCSDYRLQNKATQTYLSENGTDVILQNAEFLWNLNEANNGDNVFIINSSSSANNIDHDNGAGDIDLSLTSEADKQWTFLLSQTINANTAEYRIYNKQNANVLLGVLGNVVQPVTNANDASTWIVSCGDSCIDSDFDGVCNDVDQCPGFDNNLIGTACNDNDPNTTNDIWQSDCSCQGTLTCNPGSPCTDGDPCTAGDTYDANCNCSGGTLVDTDGDGVCDNDDQCPGVDDNLIGAACDDDDPCTIGETYNANCNCSGGTLLDTDGNGVCDFVECNSDPATMGILEGDMFLSEICSGVILTSPSGNCFKIILGDSGQLSTVAVNCP